MLDIKKITKIYKTGNFKQKALDEVSIRFRKSEFVSILGPSGSGKTTLLNIIGGLDKYTSGDLVIDGISTKKYKDSDWDSYRNHRVGFVFQSYNLIPHQSVISNVLLALTLSGSSKKESIKLAKEVLKKVGLENHMYKKPNELSGGQMQRVAIARSIVNNPDIILADEPTGALDSETSVQIMEILKNISKDKLVVMVTHNPELAKKYSSRIINIKDGKIEKDSNPFNGKENKDKDSIITKTKMSFKTALSLSFNNLMTKKVRTILVSLAGSIGIIGIALIMALSTGFQNYVDQIEEDTLTSYPLTIMKESGDLASTILSLTPAKNKSNKNEIKEEQYITKMLSSISTNDLKSFKKHIDDNYKNLDKDIAAIKYNYDVNPYIYAIDKTNKIAKLNPSDLFSSMTSSSLMSSYTSIYSQMVNNKDMLNEQYDMLKGRWPEKYNELVIVLSERGSISDLLVYSLGLRDTEELSTMVNKIMMGEKVDIKNEPFTFTYDDLLNIKLKLIKNTDLYKYNKEYNIYEDMSEDTEYMKKIYSNSLDLKIVGIVSPKEGVTTMALNPGVNYTEDLIKYIINECSKEEIVKKQLANKDKDVFSNTKFNDKKSNFNIQNLIKVDKNKLQSAFGSKLDKSKIENLTNSYLKDIESNITIDTTNSKSDFENAFKNISLNLKDQNIDEYMSSSTVLNELSKLENKYGIPSSIFSSIYSNLLNGLLNISQVINEEVINGYMKSTIFLKVEEEISKSMTEAYMKLNILTKVGSLTSELVKSISSSFNVDANKISEAFKINMNEEELKRLMTTLANKKENTANNNLLLLGYEDLEEPSRISVYFNSFDGKNNFLSFIDNYNDKVNEDKKINYTDTTGLLMSSVKTIVNAVSYVLIAFVSISLIVSSVMIGIITYISVYERTKEIGILRAIGASKRNISSIFNAETFIIGLLSGLIGIGITYILIPIINIIIHHYTGNVPINAVLMIRNAVLLVVLSIILTIIGGLIPAKQASKKDPVIALRSE